MAQTEWYSFHANRLRITKLDVCGNPVYGTASTLVTKGIIKGSIGYEWEDGEEINQKEGGGGRVTDTVGDGFPALDLDTFAVGRGEELVVRGDAVDVLDDDPRIEERGVVVEDEDRNLAKRIEVRDAAALQPRRVDQEIVVNLLFRQDDAHLAHVRAGMGADQVHRML